MLRFSQWREVLVRLGLCNQVGRVATVVLLPGNDEGNMTMPYDLAQRNTGVTNQHEAVRD